jgi:hypothetical protein
MFAEVVDP